MGGWFLLSNPRRNSDNQPINQSIVSNCSNVIFVVLTVTHIICIVKHGQKK